jgi:hypothetical protein
MKNSKLPLKKTKLAILVLLTLVGTVYASNSAGESKSSTPFVKNTIVSKRILVTPPPKGRIAVVADGNYRDPDDVGGTPVSLAILRAFGLNNKLVYYSHSCDLVKKTGEPGGDAREAMMQESCDGTQRLWGGFSGITFINCIKQKAKAINDLTIQINHSTYLDHLWIIEAGEPDIIWDAVNASQQYKRQFIHIVTHSTVNDNSADDPKKNLTGILSLGVKTENVHRIPDQNTELKTDHNATPSAWDWAKNSTDARLKWLYARGDLAQQASNGWPGIVGYFDVSDAGMVYYWATYNQTTGTADGNCTVSKLKTKFLNYIAANQKVAFGKSEIVENSVAIKSVTSYSNPSSTGIFNLGEDTSWEVYSISGVKVKQGKGKLVDISNAAKGVYLLKTTNETIKLVFQ